MKSSGQITIIGVGLIGGSLASAFSRENIGQKIVGVDIDLESLQYALNREIIDEGFSDIREGIEKADLIIIAVPVGNITSILDDIKDHAREGSLVLDVGSIKGEVIKQAEVLLTERPDLFFVGGHPMSGSERKGVGWSDPDIFQDAPFILVPLNKTPASKMVGLAQIIERIGGRVKVMDGDVHDWQVGYISHLPHLIAPALVNTITRREDHQEIFDLSAGGFRDTTRIAASQPELWVDICFSNRENLEYIFDSFLEELFKVKAMLTKEDREGLFSYFQKARQLKIELAEEGSDG